MVTTYNEVIKGLPTMYYKAYAAANDPVADNVLSWSGWTAIGVLGENGVQYELTQSGNEIVVHQFGAIDWVRTGETGTLTIQMEKSSMALMAIAFPGTYAAGATPGTNPDTLKFGGATHSFYSLGFETTELGGSVVAYFFPKCKIVGPVGATHNNAGIAQVNFNFQILKDLSRTSGQSLALKYRITTA